MTGTCAEAGAATASNTAAKTERYICQSIAAPRLCGDTSFVQQLKRKVFLKGASLREIHADAFVGAAG